MLNTYKYNWICFSIPGFIRQLHTSRTFQNAYYMIYTRMMLYNKVKTMIEGLKNVLPYLLYSVCVCVCVCVCVV